MNLHFDIFVVWMIAARFSGFFLIAPGLADLKIPPVVRGMFILWLACFIAPIVSSSAQTVTSVFSIAMVLTSELMCGLGMGLVARMVLTGVQVGGAIIDSELGLSVAQQLNMELMGAGVVGKLLVLICLSIIWQTDYMRVMIMAVVHSFTVLPVGRAIITKGGMDDVIQVGGEIFGAGLVVAAPVAVLTFIVTIALSFLARSIGQINMFAEALTMRILIGGTGLLIFFPLVLQSSAYCMSRLIPALAEYFKDGV